MAAEEEGSDSSTPTGMRISWDINITTVMVLLAAIGSGAYYVASTRSSQDVTAIRMAALENTVAQGFEGVRSELKTLPDQRARLEEDRRRLDEVDRWKGIIESKLGQVHDDETQLRSDVDAIYRASNQQLTPRPHR
jgi:hypothetical protein